MTFIVSPWTPPAMPTTSRSVGSLLSSMPALKAISVQLDRIAAMQRICVEILPPALSGHAQVAAEEGGIVLIQCDNGAAAQKIRHLAPRLLSALRRRYPGLSGVRCEAMIAHRSMARKGALRRISPTGKRALEDLAGSLPGGELKAALQRLAAGPGRLDGQDQTFEREEGERDRRHQ